MATPNQLKFLNDMGIHPRLYCEWDPVRRKWDLSEPTITKEEASAMIDEAKAAFDEVRIYHCCIPHAHLACIPVGTACLLLNACMHAQFHFLIVKT